MDAPPPGGLWRGYRFWGGAAFSRATQWEIIGTHGSSGITVPPLWNPTNARHKKGDRTLPSPRGGAAAMNGRRMHGKRQAAGAATGGVLRSAAAQITTPHRQHKNQSLQIDPTTACIDGHPQYSPPRPFLPLRTCNPQAISLRAAPPSRRGGRMLAHSQCSKYLSTISRQSSPSTIIPEEPETWTLSPSSTPRPTPESPLPSHPFPRNGPPAGRHAWILDWTRRVGPPKKAGGKPKETRCMR